MKYNSNGSALKLAYFRNNPYKNRYSGATDEVFEIGCDLSLDRSQRFKLVSADLTDCYVDNSDVGRITLGEYFQNGITKTISIPVRNSSPIEMQFIDGLLMSMS